MLLVFCGIFTKPALCETVILDYWALTENAKIECYWLSLSHVPPGAPPGAQPNPLPDREAREIACANPNYPDMHQFITELETQFSANPRCHGNKFVAFYKPERANNEAAEAWSDPHWTLTIDYKPGLSIQGWSLLDARSRDIMDHVLYEGSGGPEKIADNVCSVLSGRGGSVIR
jgi:hypothetical protein